MRLVKTFMDKLRKHPTYRGAEHTQSVLTITSNVVYGKDTGNTPDGRRAASPSRPGANPMQRPRLARLARVGLSVARLPYAEAQDGIRSRSRWSRRPTAARASPQRGRGALDMYFGQGGFHLNVNVRKETLLDAMENPDKYPQLTIRVSGYAVNFVRLTREQQLDVVNRTFHGKM